MSQQMSTTYGLSFDAVADAEGKPVIRCNVVTGATSFSWLVNFDTALGFADDFRDQVHALHKYISDELAKSKLAVPDMRLIVPNGHGPSRRRG